MFLEQFVGPSKVVGPAHYFGTKQFAAGLGQSSVGFN